MLAGQPLPPRRTGADATAAVRGLLCLRLPRGEWLFDDFSFVFVWTAAVLQLLLLFDPRYRDFPVPTFAVPVVAVVVRALLRGLAVAVVVGAKNWWGWRHWRWQPLPAPYGKGR